MNMDMGISKSGNMGLVWFPVLCCLLLVIYPPSTSYANREVDALQTFRSRLVDPNNVFQSWNSSDGNPCTWFHVTCNNDNSVVRVDLGNAALSGVLVPQLAHLSNLQYLELYANNLSGRIPLKFGKLKRLVSLDLYLNHFTGHIPYTLGKLTKLRFLRLNNNSLSGKIPMSLTSISTLQVLDLSSNKLSGEVPRNGSFAYFTPVSFADNPGLCGPVTGKPCPGSLPFYPPPPDFAPAHPPTIAPALPPAVAPVLPPVVAPSPI